MMWMWRVLLALGQAGVTLNVATASNWDASVPEYWDKGVAYESDRLAITSRLSGADGSDAPVVQKTDLTKQPGDKITFTTLQRLLGAGVSGTTALEGSEEKIVNGTYAVTVEYFRHATAADRKARQFAIWDFAEVAGKRLGEWHARFRDDNLIDQVLNQDTIQTLYAGGKSSRGNVGPADLFTTRELKRLHLALRRRGAMPFRMTRAGALPWPVYGVLMSEADYFNLTESDDFKSDVRLGADRGTKNPVFDGHVDMYQGMVLWVQGGVHPGDGMLGSYLRPEARLNAAHNASTTSFVVGPSTAVSNVDYAQYFPTSGTNTLLVDSEQVTYSSAASNTTFTVTRAANGTTAASHSSGALVTLNNIGKVLGFGANFALEAWALPLKRVRQERDYGAELGLGVEWIYEVKTVLNGDSTAANAVALEAYSVNPNTV